jgi:hypothetical protein
MIRVGRGKNSITLSGLEADFLEKSLRESIGPLIKEMEDKADIIINNAQKTWPIKTGASKEGFYKIITLINEYSFEISILNKQPYVPYIKSTAVGTEPDAVRLRSPIQTELKQPLKKIQKELNVELPKLLNKLLSEKIN